MTTEQNGTADVFGGRNGGLVEIVLEHQKASDLADGFLPPTGAVSRRTGDPRSRRLYRTNECAFPPTYPLIAADGTKIVEIRANDVHSNSEQVERNSDGEPAQVADLALLTAVVRLYQATCATLGLKMMPMEPKRSSRRKTEQNGRWRPVTQSEPCPACRKPNWCAWTPDGMRLRCMRRGTVPNGMRLSRQDADGGTIFEFVDPGKNGSPHSETSEQPGATTETRLNLDEFAERFKTALTTERRNALATSLGVTPASLDSLDVGWASADDLREMHASGADWKENWPDGAYSFAERDGGGRIVGFSFRTIDGRKGSPSSSVGARRGLIVPRDLHKSVGPVLVVEGASDVAACIVVGLPAVGRPSNTGGAKDLAKLLDARELLIVGENDAKDDGAWPGRDGAKRVATRIARIRREPVKWALPPTGIKDVREWLAARMAEGLDLKNVADCQAAGAELLAALCSAAKQAKSGRGNAADDLVCLAQEMYRFGRDDKDEAFAVEKAGPNVAIMMKGHSTALRAKLAKAYRKSTGRTPCASALGDALNVLMGEALDAVPETAHLRLATHDGAIVIDLGDADGKAVVVRKSGWEIVNHSPVLFRRTALTGPLTVPERGGTLEELRELLNVTDDTWPLIVGWLIHALIPGIPHAILLLIGIQGTAKSSATRVLVSLVDPSPAPLRCQPRDLEQWTIAASGSWVVALDNVSKIPQWLSDAMCRAATGDGLAKRKLYSDDELCVVAFRRVVAFNSIDPGVLRGDLGERQVVADLEPIAEGQRRTDAEMAAEFAKRRARIFGALLDALVAVLAKLPDVRPTKLPRMADFARVLAAADAAGVTDSALSCYMGQQGRIAGDVIEGDSFGMALLDFARNRGTWTGTASDLLAQITNNAPVLPREWPNRNSVGGRIKRLIPALLIQGVDAVVPRERSNRGRIIRLEYHNGESSQTSLGSVSTDGAMPISGDERGDDGAAGDDLRSQAGGTSHAAGDDLHPAGDDAKSGIVTSESAKSTEKMGTE